MSSGNAGGGRAEGGSDDGRDGYEHVSKGSMLLKRMGWTEGQGLGRRSDGQLQPLRVRSDRGFYFSLRSVWRGHEYGTRRTVWWENGLVSVSLGSAISRSHS